MIVSNLMTLLWNYLDSQIPDFDANSLPGIKPFIQYPHKGIKYARGEQRSSMVMMLILDIALGIMLHYWGDQYKLDSMISTLFMYFLFVANLFSFITKVLVYRMFVKLRPILDIQVLRKEIKLVFGKQIYHHSIFLTGVSMISHLIALGLSTKWLFKIKMYNVQVDKHLMIYCFIFYARLSYSYYRYRKYFSGDMKENSFSLNVFEYNEKTKNSIKCLEETNFCVICQIAYEESEKLAQVDCGNKHIYHLCCINNWLSRKPTCPLCREEVYPVDADSDKEL
jgi:Ring finger domain